MFIYLVIIITLLAYAVYDKRRKASLHQICTLTYKQPTTRQQQPQQKKQEPQQVCVKMLPRPPTMPVIGHLHLLRDYADNPWEGFNAIRHKYGNIVSLKMGIHEMALVSSKSAMNEILLSKGILFANRPNFPRYDIIFGGDRENSLALCSWSSVHKDRRKFCKSGIIPVVGTSQYELLEQSINKFVQDYIKRATASSQQLQTTNNNNTKAATTTTARTVEDANKCTNDKKPVGKLVKKDLLYLTSDIFMDFLCRESYSHQDKDYERFVEGCDYVFWDINQCYLIDFLPFLTSLGISFQYLRNLRGVTDYLRNYIDSKIFEPRHQEHLRLRSCGQAPLDRTILHLEDLYNDNIPTNTSTQPPPPSPTAATTETTFVQHYDYLDTIIRDYLDITSSMSLADYKVGFADLLAGHAAVANILMKLLGHLALNRKVQDMIADEANKVILSSSSSSSSCDITLSHKPSLPFTEAATYEALRIASSPIVPHVAQEDTTIDGHFIPQGTMMLFNNYHLNLSEELWKDPKEFDPKRFLKPHSPRSSTTEANNSNYASSGGYRVELPPHFKPFSQGRRSCLGFKMVETTTIVTVANLCRKFIIKSTDEDLTRQLLAPVGSIALDPQKRCFELELYPR